MCPIIVVVTNDHSIANEKIAIHMGAEDEKQRNYSRIWPMDIVYSRVRHDDSLTLKWNTCNNSLVRLFESIERIIEQKSRKEEKTSSMNIVHHNSIHLAE